MRWLLLAVVAGLLVPASAGQSGAEDDQDAAVMLDVSGTLYVGGIPTAGEVHVSQYSAAHKPVHDAFAQAGTDGRFTVPALADVPTTNLVASWGTNMTQASLRLRQDVDFEWSLDGVSLGSAPVRFEVVGADGGEPGAPGEGGPSGPSGLSLVVGDALHGGTYYCIGKSSGSAGGQPSVSGSPPSSSTTNEAPPCPLTWTAPGVAEGNLPRGLLTFRAEDLLWASCNWSMDTPGSCMPYVPFEGAVGVPEAGADVQVRLDRARPADSRIEGYYLSEVTGAPLARKPLFFDDGEARIVVTTDQDGSFRVGLPSGTYGVSADLCAHQALDDTVELAVGSPLRHDFVQRASSSQDVDSGSFGASRSGAAPAYPDCEGTHTPTGGPQGEAGSSSAPASAAMTPSTGPAETGLDLEAQPEIVEGSLVLHYQGLGPIGGAKIESSTDEGDKVSADRGSPAPAWVSIGALVAMALLSYRRRLP